MTRSRDRVLREEAQLEQLVDPEPFATLAAIAGVVSAVASVIAIVQARRERPIRRRDRILGALDRARDQLRHLQADVEIFASILSVEGIATSRNLRIGAAVFLRATQFDRYASTVEQIFERLRRLLKTVHRLEKLLIDGNTAIDSPHTKHLAEARSRLIKAIDDEDQTLEEALNSILAAMHEVALLESEVRALLE